jgi:hypothetical protein
MTLRKCDLTRFCHPSHTEKYNPSEKAAVASQFAMSDTEIDSMNTRLATANFMSDARLDDGGDSETDTLIVGIVLIRSLTTAHVRCSPLTVP